MEDPPLNPLPLGFGGGHSSPTAIGVSSSGDWLGFRLVGQVVIGSDSGWWIKWPGLVDSRTKESSIECI